MWINAARQPGESPHELHIAFTPPATECPVMNEIDRQQDDRVM